LRHPAATLRPQRLAALLPPPQIGALVACLLVSLIVHGRSIAFPFVLDDRLAIAGNTFLKSPQNPLLFFISDYSRGATLGPGYFRPLMMFSFWAQGVIAGWGPAPFHLVNILLHACTAWALFLAARALGCGGAAALFGALLFDVYPPNHEPVAWIVGRCDILATLFYLLGWRLVLARAGRLAFGVFVFGLLAMLGKENAATYVAMVPLTALFFWSARGSRAQSGSRTATLAGAAAVLAFVIYLALRAVAIGGFAPQSHEFTAGMNPLVRLEQPQRTLAALYMTGRLMLALVWPARLSAALDFGQGHPFPISGPLDPNVALPAAALLALLLAAVFLWRRRSRFALPLVFVLLNLLPVSNLAVVAAAFISERFLYLPAAGIALAAAVAWETAARRIAAHPGAARTGAARAGVAAAAALLLACAGLASARVEEWRDDESIYRAWSERFPQTPVFLNGLGFTAARQDHLEVARDAFERSLALDPDNPRVLSRLGSVLARLGRGADGAELLARAAALRPADPEIRNALAEVLLDLGRHDEAAREFRSLLQTDPQNARLRHELLLCLYRGGRWEAAQAEADEATRLLPDAPVFDLWRARLAARAGRMDEARGDLAEAKGKKGPIVDWLRVVGDQRALSEDPGSGGTAPANRDPRE
jgi:tetratricopeptide (TPR) repeat protein